MIDMVFKAERLINNHNNNNHNKQAVEIIVIATISGPSGPSELGCPLRALTGKPLALM